MDRPFRKKDHSGRLRSTWYWEFRVAGRRYCGSAPSFDLVVDAMALKKEAVIRERIYGPPPAAPAAPTPVPFAEFADDYFRTCCAQKKPSKRDKSILAFLKNRWPGKALRDLTVQDVLDLKAERIAIRSATTVGYELQVLKGMLKVAVELGKLERSPAASVKKPKVSNLRVSYLDADQMKALMAASTPWLRDVITFARFTGCRRGETLALTWADVDLKRGLLTLRDTKTGPAQVVEMNATVRSLLESLPAAVTKTQRVLPEATVQKLRDAWAKACTGTGLKGFRYHDLRHQAATNLVTLGATLYDVQGFLRHRSPAMTARYAHLVRERRVRTAALLDSLAPEASPQPTSGRDEGKERG